MPTPTAAARIGRYQTRLSRIVDILASHPVTVPIPGQFGKTKELTIWTGLLYKSDGRTVDTIHEWDASGAFRNQRGVSSPHDLALFTRALTDAELQAGLERLPASAKPVPAVDERTGNVAESIPAAEAPAAEAAIVDPVKDPRVSSHLAEIVWNVYQELIGEAVLMGVLPRDIVISSIRGPWAELIASTIVSYLDNPEPKPAAKEPPPIPTVVVPQVPVEPVKEAPAAATDAKSDTGEVKPPAGDEEKPSA